MGDNVEELRLWVQKNKAFLDIFLDSFCIVDNDNKVVDFNVAFTELCGESYRKILKIANFCDLIKTEMCPDRCPAKQITTSHAPLRVDELKGYSKAFPELQIIFGGIPILADDGRCLGALITIRNVSAESELQKKYNERKQESVTDGLTRLYNKVYTEGMLQKMVKSIFREPTAPCLSVVMCDIDHFKKVNDTYGHQAGDYVLSLVAQMIQGESRETDLVGRFGGEEFMAILANSDVAGAKVFSERFRKRLETTQVIFEGKRIPVTISLGTATFNTKWEKGMAPDASVKELVSRADTALYHAKANGRNQTCQFEALPPGTTHASAKSIARK